MKTVSLVLAAVSLVLSLALGAFAYDMSGKLAHLENSQNSVKAEISGLQQNLAQFAAEGKQSAAALDEVKKRMNRMIDLIK